MAEARRTGPGGAGAGNVELNKERRRDSREARQSQQAAMLRLRRQRLVECLHRLGPRPTFELVDELARRHPDIADDLDRRLAAYTERLTPELLRAVGANRFPASPLRIVGSGQ